MARLDRSIPLLALLLAVSASCRTEPIEEELPTEPETVVVVQDFPTAGTVTSADGTEIAYSSQGSGSPALVFVHGWSCDRTYWQHQFEPFAQDHRVVAIDLAGHGDSGSDRQRWSLEAFGEDVAAVVEGLDLEDVVLVGHSMGGPVSLEAARRLPGKVRGIVGVDALHDADLELDSGQWQGLIAAYRQDFAGTCDGFVRSMFLEGADPEQVDDVVKDMCAAPPEVAVKLLTLFPDYDLEAAFGAADAPIHAINAASYPTDVEGNRQAVEKFDATVMEGVGHFLMMERPEEFNQHLRTAIRSFETG